MNFTMRKVGFLFKVAVCLAGISANCQLAYVKTQVAQPVRATTATINGMVVPRGVLTTAWFEWGTDRNYGSTTAPQNVGSGNGVVRVSAPLTGLIDGGVYHFRLVASNSVGVVQGFDLMFTTAMVVQNWGSFSYGLPAVPTGLTNLSGIASGHGHCLALRNDGTVAAWIVGFSYPNYGQTNIPPGLNNVVAVAGGFSHCLALKEDSSVVTWAKYGDGTVAEVPDGLTNVIAIAGGDYHSVALKADGKVLAWGRNTYNNATNVPAGLSNVVAISSGTGHTLALKADGTVIAWGGDSGATQAPSSATNLVAVATMGIWNMALRGDGTVVQWGPTFASDVPKPVDLTNVVAIATGYAYGEVLKADGTLVGWGRGQDATNIPSGLSNVVAFASGDFHRVGLAPVNLPPRSFARSISGGINNTLPFSLLKVGGAIGFFDPNGDPLTLRITSLPTKGALYQYTDSGPGAPISTAGTIVIDANSRLIFVPEANEYGSPYATFTVTGNDGEVDTAPANWTVSIFPPPMIETTTVITAPPIRLVLGFSALSNTTYSVYFSTNLITWTFLGTATEVSTGQFSFSDYAVTNSSFRFYRVRYP